MVKMADCSDGSDTNLDDDCIEDELFKAQRHPLQEGDTWYLVPKDWLEDWKKYTENKKNPPSCIDLAPLLDENNKEELKPNLAEQIDYEVVPEECWHKLEKRFGVKDGQSAISRKVISVGAITSTKRVEIYQPEIELMKDFDDKTIRKVKVSLTEKASKIGALAKEIYKVSRDIPTQLWIRLPTLLRYEPVRDSGDTSNTGIIPGTIYVLEIQHDGKWPSNEKVNAEKIKGTVEMGNGSEKAIGRNAVEKYRNSKMGGPGISSSAMISSISSMKNNAMNSNGVRGVCGLNNLGNTCFMNSVLQCLSNTPPLVKYFLDDMYVNDLNEENPLGMRGEIARSFADLIKQMWSGVAVVSPLAFKTAVSRFASQFCGFQQHDAQELLTFLLDGLHEDLNRIREKPYINLRDSDGRPDEEVAKEAWDNYLKRNDSVIVDLFHGQLKSTVVCPKCNMVSVTFDPFCYLSLPLPPKEKEVEVTLYPYSYEEKAQKFRLNVPHRGKILDVFKALSEQTGYNRHQFVAAEVIHSHFQKIYSSEDMIDSNEFTIYQLPYPVNDPSYAVLPVCHAVQEKSKQFVSEHSERPLFGNPIFVMVPREGCTYKRFYNELLSRLRCFLDTKAIGEGQSLSNGSASSSTYHNSKDTDEIDSDDFEDGEDSEGEKDKDSMDVDNPELEFAIVNNRNANSNRSDQMDTDAGSDEGENDSEYFSIYVGDKELRPLMPSNVDEPLNFPKSLGQQTIILVWPQKHRNSYLRKNAKNRLAFDVSSLPRSSKTTQLTDCLSLYTREEQLGHNDAWYCPKCKDHIEATKKFDVWKLPKILVVHLKRFQYNRYKRDKIDTVVDCPITGLDLKKYVIDPNSKHSTVYDLIGVCNHYGSLIGGHYTAYGLNREKNEWYLFDDMHVSPFRETNGLVRSSAYVLFYQRRDEDDV